MTELPPARRSLRLPVRWGPAFEGAAGAALHRHATWELPLAATALIVVDVWADHPTASHAARARSIIGAGLVPLLAAARAGGLAVIHAPSPDAAAPVTRLRRFRHRLAGWAGHKVERLAGWAPTAWPPAAFRRRVGAWAAYARTPAPVRPLAMPYEMHPAALPLAGEAVVLTGEELHRRLRARRILHLLYVGFATNLCVQRTRDYALEPMAGRGYNPILVADCTTGLESAATVDGLLATRVAIEQMETVAASTTVAELLAALAAVAG